MDGCACRVAEAWQKNRDEVEAQGDRVVQVDGQP